MVNSSVNLLPRLFGDTTYFARMSLYKEVILLTNSRFRKQHKVNAYTILGVNGTQTLTVPLESHRNDLCYRDVKIAYHEPWASKHLHSIRSAYGNSPYFEHYFDDIRYLLEKKFVYIVDLNIASLEYICNKIKIKDLVISIDHTDLKAQNNPIEVIPSSIPEYLQVWTGKHTFVPNLSIIDLLFCHGPESKTFLPNF
ncbi:MAG: WbqC family protein [Saprospiraceae bacterium]